MACFVPYLRTEETHEILKRKVEENKSGKMLQRILAKLIGVVVLKGNKMCMFLISYVYTTLVNICCSVYTVQAFRYPSSIHT